MNAIGSSLLITAKVLLLGILAATVSLAQSSAGASATKPADPTSEQALLALVPASLPAPAGAPSASASFYGPETLYKYMDGGADAFLLYDFQLLLHEDLRAKDVDVALDIFDMNTPVNAFGMYASERSPAYHYIAVGAEGYENQGILNFVQGRYYVKLAGFGAGADAVLEEYAQAMAAKIGTETSLPAELNLLPATNRKAHTEQFLLKDPLGHPFLAPAILARYDVDRQESTLLLSMAADAAEARTRLQLLAAHFKSAGTCEPAPEWGEGAIRASSSFEGKIIAAANGRYVVMLINPTSAAEALLREGMQRLK